MDAACWGAVIGGASYTASVAFSDGGFINWSWNQFGKSVGVGALLGAATFGVGEILGGTGTFMNEVGRGLSHELVQGGASVLEGGDFWSGFASGTLGSWAGHGASALGITDTKLGTLVFSTLSGGVGSWAAGGDFMEGAASGLMVGLLNQLQHDVQTKQQQQQATREYIRSQIENNNKLTWEDKFRLRLQLLGGYDIYFWVQQNGGKFMSPLALANPLVSVPNDLKTLFTGVDLYGYPATTFDRVVAGAGVLKKVKNKYLKFLIQFLILFIVVELLLIMRWIIFSDNPLTGGEFLSDLPFMVIACLAVVFFRGLLFMSPKNKKDR